MGKWMMTRPYVTIELWLESPGSETTPLQQRAWNHQGSASDWQLPYFYLYFWIRTTQKKPSVVYKPIASYALLLGCSPPASLCQQSPIRAYPKPFLSSFPLFFPSFPFFPSCVPGTGLSVRIGKQARQFLSFDRLLHSNGGDRQRRNRKEV